MVRMRSTAPTHAAGLDTEARGLGALGDVLAIWAHPDDETYLAAGLLAGLRDAGARVVCVTATRGEAADPAARPEERAALAAVRTEELEDDLALQLRLGGAALDRKVEALLQQVSQTGGLVAAAGRERFSAWVATESFALPLATR